MSRRRDDMPLIEGPGGGSVAGTSTPPAWVARQGGGERGCGNGGPGGAGVVVVEGDCLEVMAGMEAGSVDAIVTDPPFGIGFDYGGTREIANNPEDYWDWLRPRYLEMLRCLRSGGLLAIWQTQLYFPHFWRWFGDGIHVYCSAKNFVQMRPTPINYGYDPVVMFYKGGADPLRPAKPRRSVDYFVANTASVVSDRSRVEKRHPCPRPLDQVIEILDNFVLPGGIVLDPFAGSGTTLVGCAKTERNGIGIEADGRYIPLIHRRLAEAATPLFDSLTPNLSPPEAPRS